VVVVMVKLVKMMVKVVVVKVGGGGSGGCGHGGRNLMKRQEMFQVKVHILEFRSIEQPLRDSK
jgi:hypothetical protein